MSSLLRNPYCESKPIFMIIVFGSLSQVDHFYVLYFYLNFVYYSIILFSLFYKVRRVTRCLLCPRDSQMQCVGTKVFHKKYIYIYIYIVTQQTIYLIHDSEFHGATELSNRQMYLQIQQREHIIRYRYIQQCKGSNN